MLLGAANDPSLIYFSRWAHSNDAILLKNADHLVGTVRSLPVKFYLAAQLYHRKSPAALAAVPSTSPHATTSTRAPYDDDDTAANFPRRQWAQTEYAD